MANNNNNNNKMSDENTKLVIPIKLIFLCPMKHPASENPCDASLSSSTSDKDFKPTQLEVRSLWKYTVPIEGVQDVYAYEGMCACHFCTKSFVGQSLASIDSPQQVVNGVGIFYYLSTLKN